MNTVAPAPAVNWQTYESTIREALSALDKKNLSMIIHGTSFPAVSEQDTGCGSPFSEGARRLTGFLKTHGFNSIQLGPAGKTKSINPSPYTGSNFSGNPLFIDLTDLAVNPRWGGILNPETVRQIVENNPKAGENRMAYDYIYPRQEAVLREAWQGFQKRKDQLPELAGQFEDFKNRTRNWLEKDALYEALSIKHGNDYWPVWQDDLDKRLFNPKDAAETEAAKARIDEIYRQQGDIIEQYQFAQFILFEQQAAMKKFAEQNGITLIADCQVGLSDRDQWAYQSLFMRDYFMGVPPDYFSKDGQKWDFPVLDPEQIRDASGNLLAGGKLVKAMFDKMFAENPGGVRIDHIIGLIDPWVYGKKDVPLNGARLYSSPDHPELGKYARIAHDDLNADAKPDDEDWVKTVSDEQLKRYAALLDIVFESAREHGIPLSSVICEDLGTLTHPVEKLMNARGLSGIRVSQFADPTKDDDRQRGKNVDPRYWFVTGTHDNEPLMRWAKRLFSENQAEAHAWMLANDMVGDAGQREGYVRKLLESPKNLVEAKYVELFASPPENIQFFFSDFFGVDGLYNHPGHNNGVNWTLRLPNPFESDYYASLKKHEGVNLPAVLKQALELRGLSEKLKSLIARLSELASQLIAG